MSLFKKKKQTSKEKYLKSERTSELAYVVNAETGEYVHIKHITPVDVGVELDLYVHKALKGLGFVVSEGQSGQMLSSGKTQELAVEAAKSKVQGFIDRYSIEAFYDLLLSAKEKLKSPNPRYLQVIEKIEVIEPIEIIEELPVQVEEVTLATVVRDCLNYKNTISLEYISETLGWDIEETEQRLLQDGHALMNPETNELESPDEYLSGNVKIKLQQAEKAARMNPRFEINVEKLKEVIPEIIPSAFIQYSLGAAWIPVEVFGKFATQIFATKTTVQYLLMTGKFSVKAWNLLTPQIRSTYEAGGKTGIDIFTATLNNQQISITETIAGKSQKNINKTTAAQSMQEQMQDEFQAFIRANKDIQDETEAIYNERHSSYIPRNYRVPELTHYPGAAEHYMLRIHQKTGVLRGIENSVLFAHQPGLGKTALAITLAMELRRLGLANKPMIAVQKATYSSFVNEFYEIYPNANILAPSDSEMSLNNRAELYHKIRDGDWDCIVMPHSQFELMPDSIDRQKAELSAELNSAWDLLNRTDKRSMPEAYAHLNRLVKSLHKELDELRVTEEERNKVRQQVADMIGHKPMINFEDMNIDALLIDEAHRFKRLGFATSLSAIRGVDFSKSKRSQSLLLKMRWIQGLKQGKNTYFLTGTPISNTMAEVWTMIRFVRPDILLRLGIEHFDQFAKTFGQVVPSLEMRGDGSFKIVNRFAKFQNVPELVAAFRECADIKFASDVPEFQRDNTIPELLNGQITQVIVPRSPELVEQIKEFRETLEWFDGLEGMKKRQYCYIPLVTYNRAKQASIDLRLLNPLNVDSPQSKANECVRRAMRVYRDTGLVQLIFCDLYQSPEPKEAFLDEDCTVPNSAYGVKRFNLFVDIKNKLIAQGVPADQIAILTEPKYSKVDKMAEMELKANKGLIKFLLGTTERLGIGRNVQRRAIAGHHIDAPNRPMDFEQRNKRIERQKNLNKIIELLAYGTEKTLDSAAFQRLSIKQKFINQIMKGEKLERVMDDAADEVEMTFDEMMAHLSDSPYAMQKLLVDNRLKSEILKRDNFFAKQVQTQRQLNYALEDISKLQIELAEQDKYEKEVKQFFGGGIVQLEADGLVSTEHFGSAAETYIEILMERYHNSASGLSSGYILLNDVKVMLRIHKSSTYSSKAKRMIDRPQLTYFIPEIGIFERYDGSGIHVDSNSGVGLIQSIKWKIETIRDAPQSIRKKIGRFKVTTEELERSTGQVFDETKLEALEHELEALKQKMLSEKVPVEQEVLQME